MVPERVVDPAALYERERLAFVALVHQLDAEELATQVRATPGWCVSDVPAHLVGITADLNAQQFGDDGGDAWTAAQVATRRGRSVTEVCAEWDREAPIFEGGLSVFGYNLGAHYLADLLQHVADVRSTLGRPSVSDDGSIAVALDFYLMSFEKTLDDVGIGAVDVHAGDEHFHLGSGPTVASVRASRFGLFRALGGRRTLDEIRELDWSGDANAVDAVVGRVSRYPLPARTLGEPADRARPSRLP